MIHRKGPKARLVSLAAPLSLFMVGCVGAEPGASQLPPANLSVAQCEYFQVGGRVTICHATGSARNPYVLTRVSDAACISAHATHAADHVAINGSCGPDACLPVGAPVDATLACCPGLTARAGTCQVADRCLGVTCPADQCHVSSCDGATGLCVTEPKVEGFACSDGVACTLGDTCRAGSCAPGGPACPATSTCANVGEVASCECLPGYSGGTCSDINECATDNGGCSPQAACSNTAGGNTCACLPGFSGDGRTCADVDECATGAAGCGSNATCTNTFGGATCACASGYSGDGVTCVDVDECATDNGGCGANATCTNTVGSNTCACDAGFTGDGRTCADVDECATGAAGCGSNATCTNTPGSAVCACAAGYSGDGRTCADVDECANGTAGCGSNATCTNTAGSFACGCAAGFADCDANAANGCEVAVTSDRGNCGACGRVCGAIEACVAGVCGQRSCAVAGTAGCGLVAIAGGPTFTMGSSATGAFYNGNAEQPDMAVGSFAIDASEVTVARFNAFWAVRSRDVAAVRAAPIAYPSGQAIAWGPAAVIPAAQTGAFNWSSSSTTRNAHPMNGVTYWTAQEFCVWDGGRLPTEAEWEFAARGRALPADGLASGRLFPWGSTYPSTSCDRALWRNCGGADGGSTRRVGSFPTGDSGGLHDMAGNVYEWMADTYQAYRPSGWASNLNPLSNIDGSTDRIVRGGSWGDSDPNGLLSVARFTAPAQLTNNPYVGFRCARALP